MTQPLSRRRFFGCACVGAASLLAPTFSAFAAQAAGHKASAGVTADQALKMLRDGNADYVADKPSQALIGRARRSDIAKEQHPFAVVLSCSDSRVPPELLFNRGLGELFVIRNAGNTVDTSVLGSMEYAIEHLAVPLVVVMGHQRCGAVGAAIAMVDDHKEFPDAIGPMIEPILPAVLLAKQESGDLSENAVRRNVSRSVAHLRSLPEPIFAEPLHEGRLRIVGAEYSLDDGAVDFFDLS